MYILFFSHLTKSASAPSRSVFVEKKPCEETREVSCREPYFAWTYALYVDGTPHPKTREGVRADPYWRGKYRIWESGFGVDWRKNGGCL